MNSTTINTQGGMPTQSRYAESFIAWTELVLTFIAWELFFLLVLGLLGLLFYLSRNLDKARSFRTRVRRVARKWFRLKSSSRKNGFSGFGRKQQNALSSVFEQVKFEEFVDGEPLMQQYLQHEQEMQEIMNRKRANQKEVSFQVKTDDLDKWMDYI